MPLDTAAIDAVIEKLRKTADAPGASLAVVHGDDVYVQGYGIKEKGKDAPVTPDTLFANASTTKAVTAAAVALLVDEGKMAWDDPVRKHLPTFRLSDPAADSLVTIRDLLCHRTGLPRHDMLWYHSPLDRAEILRRIGHAKPTAGIRATYQYQNICFLAAGEAVRAASGAESFDAFVKERLLTPLGMARTNLSADDAQADPDHATPHQRIKGKLKATPWLNFDNIGPAGTMNSCAREMAAWLKMQLSVGLLPNGTRLISEANLRETWTPQMVVRVDEETRARYPHLTQMSYGLGWSQWNYKNGRGVLTHGGAIDGFRAHVALLPDEKIGIALFVNQGLPFVEMARNALFDLLLDLSPTDWNDALKTDLKKSKDDEAKNNKERRDQRKNGKPSPVATGDFAGEYDEPAYGTVTVKATGKGDKKQLTFTWLAFDAPLKHQTFTTFLAEPDPVKFSPTEVKFTLDAEGNVAGLRVFDTDFTRRPAPKSDEKKK